MNMQNLLGALESSSLILVYQIPGFLCVHVPLHSLTKFLEPYWTQHPCLHPCIYINISGAIHWYGRSRHTDTTVDSLTNWNKGAQVMTDVAYQSIVKSSDIWREEHRHRGGLLYLMSISAELTNQRSKILKVIHLYWASSSLLLPWPSEWCKSAMKCKALTVCSLLEVT